MTHRPHLTSTFWGSKVMASGPKGRSTWIHSAHITNGMHFRRWHAHSVVRPERSRPSSAPISIAMLSLSSRSIRENE